MKLGLFALSLVALQGADLAGRYELQGVREVGSELLLRLDGTFEFMLAYGAADYQASGAWKQDGAAVLLTTTTPEAPPFKLLRSAATETPGSQVRVVGPNGRPVPNIDVRSGPAKARTDSAGIAEFETRALKAVAFEIRVYQLDAGPYTVNPAHNDFTFEINGEAIATVRFKSEKLTLEDGALVMRRGGGPPMRYVKRPVN